MKQFQVICYIFILNAITLTYGLSCKNEDNKNVDWFIIYKLPKISEDNDDNLKEGTAYTYLDPDQNKWKLSSNKVTSEMSVLGLTWQELKDNEESATYLLYNDEAPGSHKKASGHLKGVLAFDGKSGYWLTHSIPNFVKLSSAYEYPKNALINGQHAFCVTYNTDQLSEIVEHLRFTNPNIYERHLTDEVADTIQDETTKSMFEKKPQFVTKEPLQKITDLKSKGGLKITGFAKDNQLKIDIYSEMIAPHLKTSLYTNTWRRGAGGNLHSFCEGKYTVVDVIDMDMMALAEDEKKEIFFKSTQDHSKWAVSTSANKKIVCMADINRMNSQENRGGGALCFQSAAIWKQFQSMIHDSSDC